VGNPRWGILEPYIEEEYTLIMNNKLFMEVNAAGGKFCISEGVLKKRRICLFLLCLVLAAFPVLAEEAGEAEVLIEQAKNLLTAEDYEAAISILQKEAEKGNAEAQNELGKCYANGTGVEQNDEEAFKYFQMAADQGYAKSLYNVGVYYENGLGVDQDDTKAVRYFKLAADQGLPYAQCALGYFYENGISVEQDLEKAVTY
jgi:TPR repeat protein